MALAELYHLSGGVPRVINVVADRALLGAYTQDRHRVTSGLVRHAAAEVFGRRFAPRWLPWLGAAPQRWYSRPRSGACGRWRSWRQPAAGCRRARRRAKTAAARRRRSPNLRSPRRRLRPPRLPPCGRRAAASAAVTAGAAAQHKDATGTDDAFAQLFGLWGAHYVAGDTDPCTQAAQQGMECLVQRGSFGQLRVYNRPAILLLNDDAGAQTSGRARRAR